MRSDRLFQSGDRCASERVAETPGVYEEEMTLVLKTYGMGLPVHMGIDVAVACAFC